MNNYSLVNYFSSLAVVLNRSFNSDYSFSNSDNVPVQDVISSQVSGDFLTPNNFAPSQHIDPSLFNTTNYSAYPQNNNSGLISNIGISTPAEIAIYDDFLSAPRLIKVPPSEVGEFIESLASNVYSHAKELGGLIPYTTIREVCENFIHANFNEIVVSILDNGNTIRFSDQGPGIIDKEKVKMPGFTSANQSMKHYIRGVGSGLPIVCEYLTIKSGSISIDDNVNGGSVVTISIVKDLQNVINDNKSDENNVFLNNEEKQFLRYFYPNKILGVTDLHLLTKKPISSVHKILEKLRILGLIDTNSSKKRYLSEVGKFYCENN